VQKIISGRILSIHNESKTNTAKNDQPIRAQSAFTKTDTAVKKSEPISHYAENMTPISSITWRMRAHVQGKVNSIKAAPSDSSPLVEVEIWDESGGITLQFLGRREISGLEVGSEMRAEGMVGENNGQLVILNPSYEIVI
jgi:RecG-like helicase